MPPTTKPTRRRSSVKPGSPSPGRRRDSDRKQLETPRRRRSISKTRGSGKRRRTNGRSSSLSSTRSGSLIPELPAFDSLRLTPAKPSNGANKSGEGDSKPRVIATIKPRVAKQITAALVTITKNNQGEDNSEAYCLAALAANIDGSPRLIRLVPDIGHFWSNESLPQELRDIHGKPKTSLPSEPQWPFIPVVVGFEAGTLPDNVTGPHRMDDVVARKLEYISEVDEPLQLYEQLNRIAFDDLTTVWPIRAWATPKSLIPNFNVPSLAIFNGEITRVEWRPCASPHVDIKVDGREIHRLPYAAHRLHDDKGYDMLQWMREQTSCLILLGLSRTFCNGRTPMPQCPILLLRIFPCF